MQRKQIHEWFRLLSAQFPAHPETERQGQVTHPMDLCQVRTPNTHPAPTIGTGVSIQTKRSLHLLVQLEDSPAGPCFTAEQERETQQSGGLKREGGRGNSVRKGAPEGGVSLDTL